MTAKRPWEEEWELSPCGGSVVTPLGSLVSYRSRGQRRKDVARLAVAAPDMARAIKAFLSDNGHTPDCGHNGTGVFASDDECSEECRGARAALRKAGVIE